MGVRTPQGKGQFWGISSPLKSSAIAYFGRWPYRSSSSVFISLKAIVGHIGPTIKMHIHSNSCGSTPIWVQSFFGIDAAFYRITSISCLLFSDFSISYNLFNLALHSSARHLIYAFSICLQCFLSRFNTCATFAIGSLTLDVTPDMCGSYTPMHLNRSLYT